MTEALQALNNEMNTRSKRCRIAGSPFYFKKNLGQLNLNQKADEYYGVRYFYSLENIKLEQNIEILHKFSKRELESIGKVL
jgi:hypothetical protein